MTDKKVISLALILFLLNPLISIVFFSAFFIISDGKKVVNYNHSSIILAGVLCSIFVSLVNMVKVPDSDLGNYVFSYSLASRFGYLDFLLVGPDLKFESYKDPLYHSIVWVMNRSFSGNVHLFILSMSLLIYGIAVYALILLGEAFRMKISVVMTGLLLLCFTPYIFFNSAHLIRQSLANSILCYVMVKHFFYGKKAWIGMLSMILIHSSSALFLPVLLLPVFGKPFRQSWPWCLGTMALIVFIQSISSFFMTSTGADVSSTAGYALSRASSNAVGNYELALSSLLLCLIMLIYAIMLYRGKIMSVTNDLRRFTFSFIYLEAFILLSLQQGLWASRFSHYQMTLIPFMSLFFFQSKRVNNVVLFLITSAIIIFWSVYLYTGIWTYDIPMGPWLTPVASYFLINNF